MSMAKTVITTTATTPNTKINNNNNDRRGFMKGLLVGIVITYLNIQLLMLQKVHNNNNTTTVICSTNDNPTIIPRTTTQVLRNNNVVDHVDHNNHVSSTFQQKRRKITTTTVVENSNNNNPTETTTTATANNSGNRLKVLNPPGPSSPKSNNDTFPSVSSSTSQPLLQQPTIPHRIIITHKYKTLEEIPEPYLGNIRHTIQVYREFWNDDDDEADIWYLNDEDCQSVIEQVDIRLLKWFWFETRGMYKSDMCRYSALWLKGGYYFDNDMQVVQPVQLQPHTKFVSPFEWGYNLHGNPRGQGLFNSFVAVSPKHPIMKKALDYAFEYYDSKQRFGSHMGTGALFHAYVEMTNSNQMGYVDMQLHETQLTNYMYPDFPRLDGIGCCCDMVVHNMTNQQVYFYSHMVGSKGKVTCGVKS